MNTHDTEHIKRSSRRLRGTLADSLADAHTGALRADDTVLLKFHGSYQQDDRDLRDERRRQKLEPAWQFMIRTRTPGGVVTPDQWRALDDIATRYGNGTLRLTTRQAFQLHGVIKSDLKPTLQSIHAALIDTIAACGDVNRNVLVAANPLLSNVHAAVHADAAALATQLLPRTRAWHELWLDGEPMADSGSEVEPVYGETYLPRKFKIAFAVPPLNDVDVLAQDLGFGAVVEQGALLGYDVSVGGGMGATHGDVRTYPLLAQPLGFIERAQLPALAVAVVTTQRDHGSRAQRTRARLKYTIEDRGLDWFRAEVARRAGFAIAPCRGLRYTRSGDRFGWVEGEDGRWHLTLQVPAGRIADGEGAPHRRGLRAIAEAHDGHFRLTPNQNLMIAGVPPEARARVDTLVAAHALDGYRHASPLARNALACVALPTCALAMAEAERYLPRLVMRIEALLAAHGLVKAPILLRVSGCPNGCSRPYLGEIGLVGKGPGRYNLHLGAVGAGQRLNVLYRENVDEAALLAALEPLLARYAAEREADEGFGDFLLRARIVAHAPRSIEAAVLP